MSEEIINKTYDEVLALKDLFLRRLMDDKIKNAAMVQLKEQNELLQQRLDEKNLSAFVKEILLICDRVESQESIDSLTASVKEEILELLARREIYQMEQTDLFDPRYHNAVGTVLAGEEYPDKSIVKVVRNGYLLRDQIFRPADVIVAVKTANEE